MRRLKRENAELRRANGILKAAPQAQASLTEDASRTSPLAAGSRRGDSVRSPLA